MMVHQELSLSQDFFSPSIMSSRMISLNPSREALEGSEVPIDVVRSRSPDCTMDVIPKSLANRISRSS